MSVLFTFMLSVGLFASVNEKPYLLENEKNTISVFQKSENLVVFIHNLRNYRSMFDFSATEMQAGSGSGFLWDNRGYIVTNYHVIAKADKISVTLRNGKTHQAKFIGAEPKKDIAVLKIKANGLPSSGFSNKLSDSGKLLVGQKSLAIGNPFGLDRTLTVGVISAVGRSVPSMHGVTIRDMIQTDASINPGNSGGPLLDSRGFLLGMNTVIYSKSGSSAGIGFAVPSNTIRRVAEQIIKHGKVIQPGLGIVPLDDRVADYLGYKGVVIGSVGKNTPAQKAGLKGTSRMRNGRISLGDIIIAIDNETIKNYDDLYNALEDKSVGQLVNVKVLRNDKPINKKLKLIVVND